VGLLKSLPKTKSDSSLEPEMSIIDLWRSLMTEERRAYYREYYRKNKERLYKQQKERFAKNPEKRKAVINRYAEKHREKLLAKNRDYKKTLKGCLAYKISHLKKAKRSRKLEVVIDVDFLLLLWEKQQGICAISSTLQRIDTLMKNF
jgi:hypothetical protein